MLQENLLVEPKKMNNKKRVGVIHYTLPPAISGVEMVIRDHSRLLSNMGYRIYLLGATGKKFRSEIGMQLAHSFDPKNKNVLLVQEQLKESIVSPDFERLKHSYIKTIGRWIEKNHLEMVIVHNVLSRHYNLALTAAIVDIAKKYHNSVRFITWVHDASFVDTFYTKVNISLKKQYPWNLIASYQNDFTYVTISETRKRELLQLYGKDKKITVIPNGIDLNKMLPLPLQTRQLFKDILMRDPDFIGVIPVRIAERKNIEFAIDFAQKTKELYGKKMCFIVTGALHLQNPEAIKYFAFLKNKINELKLEEYFLFLYEYRLSTGERFDIYKLNIRDLYLISDFLFLPSKGEGFGLPIIEAGFIRLPIFVSNIDVFKEVGNGYINFIDINAPVELTVNKILDYLRKSRTTIFHKSILKKYSLEQIVRQRIVNELFNNNNQGSI